MPRLQMPLTTISKVFPVNGPPWGDVHPLSPPPHILPNPQKGAPLTELLQRCSSFLSPPKILSQQLYKLPNGPLKREASVSGIFFYTFPSKSPVNAPPLLHVPHQVPHGERSLISRASG